MTNDNQAVPWTHKDAIALRGFVAQNPRFLSRLRQLRPAKPDASNEARANYGSQVLGMDAIITEIESMQLDPQQNDLPAGFIASEDVEPQE